MKKLALPLALLALPACASLFGRDVPPEVKACLAQPEVQDYIEAMRKDVVETWELPEGADPSQSVEIVFSLREDGHLKGAMIDDAATQEIEDSALAALEAAAPFPPLTGPVACLTDMALRAEFRNPADRSAWWGSTRGAR